MLSSPTVSPFLRSVAAACLLSFVITSSPASAERAQDASPAPATVFGYRDFTAQAAIDKAFLAVPDAKLAGQHLKTLTSAPHIAGSKEDYATAEYVAARFKAAGLQTEIVPYLAWLNLPKEIKVTAIGADGKTIMNGPSPEHVSDDPYQDDPRVTPGFNGSSPSGDVSGEVVYANYGRPEDFQWLEDHHVDLKGRIILVRYGNNFRGVKVYVAEQHGAAGVIIYSDPADDGYYRGDKYPKGPYRPDSGIQRGSVQYLFKYPGDSTTPGVASTPDLPKEKRLTGSAMANLPRIPATPISYLDASPMLERLGGLQTPHDWQGALPFTYHVGGTSAVKAHVVLRQEYALQTIWDVIGKIPGTDFPDSWVVAGNHRDAWVYGAVDPNSGTAAMLETVHGIGELLKSGWKPKRTVIFGSWDAEEEGLIGSTEWAEQHEAELSHAAAYFNTDVAVGGPNFDASSVPSLKGFIREVTRAVPSPRGGSVYDQWKIEQAEGTARLSRTSAVIEEDVRVGDLGSGSDYTPFIQHVGVPSTDIGSGGPYGVYHSVFDNYAWFTKFADPTFVYEQQQARVFGLEVLHMADTDVLPYDYGLYGKEIAAYLDAAQKKSAKAGMKSLDFAPAIAAAQRFTAAGNAIHTRQVAAAGDLKTLNEALRAAETAFLIPDGLPNRPWFRHSIYAPGEYTGYAAVVIPGVNEAIDSNRGQGDAARASSQLIQITAALNRAASILESAR